MLQFQSAVLTAPATYELSLFLRGQAGTEAAMRAPLAAGARFVLLDAAPTLVDMSQDEIGLAYTWRCGPANRDIGHASYLETTHVFSGVGLRPLSPAHVRGLRSAGDLAISWVRRTRLGGDSWDAAEVPLGEETERYEVDILDGTTVKRTLSHHLTRRHLHRRPANRRLRRPPVLGLAPRLPAQPRPRPRHPPPRHALILIPELSSRNFAPAKYPGPRGRGPRWPMLHPVGASVWRMEHQVERKYPTSRYAPHRR